MNSEEINLNIEYEHYEKMPKAKYFWSQSSDYPQYCGKSFKIIGREIQNFDYGECCWVIEFKDGSRIYAYADEIFLPEMKGNGYTGE